MKEINDMKLAEVEQEIKEFEHTQFMKSKKYVFVSYSHQNKEVVLRKVLEWIRNGYNIYIDLDFESHGSEENWVDIMYKMIRSNACVMAVCFRSEDYYYSYASLIELLTMRSRETTLDRRGQELPIDILQLDAVEKTDEDFSSDEVEEKYNILFEGLKKNMGSKFLQGKEAEQKQLLLGLESIYEYLKYNSVNEAMQRLQRSYEDGVLDFYPQVASFMMAGFRVFDLNGNTKSVKSEGVITRFEKLHVYCSKSEKDKVSKASIIEKVDSLVVNEDLISTVENHNVEINKQLEISKTDNAMNCTITYSMTLKQFREYMSNTSHNEEISSKWERMKKTEGYVMFAALLGGAGVGKAYSLNFTENIAQLFSGDKPAAGTWISSVAGAVNGKDEEGNKIRKLMQAKKEYPSIPESMTIGEVKERFVNQYNDAYILKGGSLDELVDCFDILTGNK